MQLKIKMFLGTVLLVDEPVPKVGRRFTGTGQRRGWQLHMANCHTKTEKDNAPKPTDQCQPCGISIYQEHSNTQCEFTMVAYSEILFYISYTLCIAFRLYSSMIVFYTSLEVIRLAFLENKSRYVCCIFANLIFTFETKG